MSNPAYLRLRQLLAGSTRLGRGDDSDTALLARVKRIVGGAPEALVKTNSTTYTSAQVREHLRYITRDGELVAETEREELIRGKKMVERLIGDWTQHTGRRELNTRFTKNFVLATAPTIDPQILKRAAVDFAKEAFHGNHHYVFALHGDTHQPHVHLSLYVRGLDDHRFQESREDSFIQREIFAQMLRNHGFESEATPRYLRGVIHRSTPWPIRKLRDNGKLPKTDELRIRSVAKEIVTGVSEPKPWLANLEAQQVQVRREWIEAARELAASPLEFEREVAGNILRFVQSMPPLQTQRGVIKDKMLAQLEREQRDRRDRAPSGADAHSDSVAAQAKNRDIDVELDFDR